MPGIRVGSRLSVTHRYGGGLKAAPRPLTVTDSDPQPPSVKNWKSKMQNQILNERIAR